MNRYFSKEDRNGYLKKFSTSLIIRGMQIKTSMRYHLTLVRLAVTKRRYSKCWQGCREKETLAHCWWGCKLVQPFWKTLGDSSQNFKSCQMIQQFHSTPGYTSKENEIHLLRYLYSHIFCSAIHSNQELTCLSANEWIKKMGTYT